MVIDPAVEGSKTLDVEEPSNLANEIIHSAAFQRLRFVNLGVGTRYASMMGNVTRFAHCAGVGRGALRFAKILAASSAIQLSSQELLAVEVAGLCHDIGHGPFSHTFEMILHDSGIEWCHERNCIALIKDIFSKKQLSQKYGLSDDFLDAVTDMILGIGLNEAKAKYASSATFRHAFLFFIVNGSHSNEFDMDKVDYMMRDLSVLIPHADYEWFRDTVDRILSGARVVDDAIVFGEMQREDLRNFFHARFILYANYYWKEPCVSSHVLIQMIFESVRDRLDLKGHLASIEDFLQLNDTSMIGILKAASRGSEHATRLFERFETGTFFPMIGEFEWSQGALLRKKEIRGKISLLMKEDGNLEDADFLVSVVDLHHGMRISGPESNADPLQKTTFYDNGQAVHRPFPRNLDVSDHNEFYRIRFQIFLVNEAKAAEARRAILRVSSFNKSG